MKDENKEKLERIARYYGYEAQSRQCIEEMAELTQAINKHWRKAMAEHQHTNPVKADLSVIFANIYEEIADVEICLEQVKCLLDCSDEVERLKDVKINRQLERMESGI